MHIKNFAYLIMKKIWIEKLLNLSLIVYISCKWASWFQRRFLKFFPIISLRKLLIPGAGPV